MEEEMEGRKADDGGRSFKTGTDQVVGVTIGVLLDWEIGLTKPKED